VFAPWTVLIVDDDPEVHAITRLVLKGFEYDGRGLRLLSALSAAEARSLLATPQEIALALVDVVMESDSAGLLLVKHIREDLQNRDMRIVLRTGQPGMAPEESVIRNYDINDYKSKTELTTTKLNTLLFSALRSYRDICLLNTHRSGLERAINALSTVARTRSIPTFASAVLGQLTNLIRSPQAASYWNVVTLFAERKDDPQYRLLAVSGLDADAGASERSGIPTNVDQKVQRAFRAKRSIIDGVDYVGYFRTQMGSENLLFLAECGELSALDVRLLDLYCSNVAIAYENLLLHEEIEESQRELIFMLGEAVEMRSKETSGHVRRVAAMAAMLANDYGLPDAEIELIRHAAPLHDVGKVGIPDHILNKPGRHTPDEWDIMRTHARLGFDMLNKSDKRILKRGAIVALQHHEKWDGSGYPDGLAGEDIDIFARITTLADVFDALGSNRCYKQSWEVRAIVDLIEDQSGKHFDPRLVDLLLAKLPSYLALRDIYPD
jgi:response regulator RpfG family c-di-GMP phosphodiesterase